MANYQKGFEYIIHDKDISIQDQEELKSLISKFLIEKGYNNPKIHKIGTYDLNFQPVWENCFDLTENIISFQN